MRAISLPPVAFCPGTSPSQAASWRPEAKTQASGSATRRAFDPVGNVQ
jgi:hypothetical protein